MVVDAWWFALLFAVPSALDPAPVEFGMRSLAFSGYYWLACCAFAGVALAPRVAARIGGRAFAGRRGRFVRAACIALAAMWFCASSVLAISARCLGAADAYAAASSLHGIWKVTSIGSMIACAVHMYLRAAYDRSVDAPSRALLVVLLTCSVCIGFLRAPAFSALMLGAVPMGYMQEMVSPLFAPIMFVPLGIIGAFLQRSSRVAGARGLFACAWGLCAGEITARMCTRYLPDLFFWFIDNPLVSLGLVAAALAASFLAPILLSDIQVREPASAAAEVLEDDGESASCGMSFDNVWGLSERELEATRLLIEGFSSKEASARMGISPSTVRSLWGRARAKMGVDSIEDARELVAPGVDDMPNDAEGLEGAEERDGAKGSHGRFFDPASLDARLKPVARALSLFALIGVMPWSIVGVTWNLPNNVCIGISLGLLFSMSFFAVAEFFPKLPCGRDTLGIADVACLGLAAAAVWIANLWFLMALPAAAFVAAVLVGRVLHSELSEESGLDDALQVFLVAALMVVAGLVLAISWRSSSWPYTASIEPYAWSLKLVVLIFVIEHAASKRFACALATGAAGAAAIYAMDTHGMQFALPLVALCLLVQLDEGNRPLVFSSKLPMAAFALGVLVGMAGVNAIGSHLYETEVVQGAMSELRARAALGLGLGAIGAATVIAAVALAAARYYRSRLLDAARDAAAIPRDRMEAVCVAMGLDALEAKVIIQTLHGCVCSAIARDLYYSPSAVYAVRRGAYAKLGVHDAQGALDKIQQVTGL